MRTGFFPADVGSFLRLLSDGVTAAAFGVAPLLPLLVCHVCLVKVKQQQCSTQRGRFEPLGFNEVEEKLIYFI